MEPTSAIWYFLPTSFPTCSSPHDGWQHLDSQELVAWWNEATESLLNPAGLPRQGRTVLIHPDQPAWYQREWSQRYHWALPTSLIWESHVPRSIQVSDPIQHSKHPKQTHSGPPRGKHRSLIFAILLLKVCLAWQGISSLDSSMCQSDKLRVNCGRNRHFLSGSLEILKSKEKKRERETLINKSIH